MRLELDGTSVADLSPLSGMKLDGLFLLATPVSDLSPLKGARIRQLRISLTKVTDLTPLANASIQSLALSIDTITNGIEALRDADIGMLNGISPAEFWKRYDAGEFGPKR